MGTNIAELQQLLAKKDVRIRELEVENMTLRSQLDKYHSVFNLGDGSSSPSAGTTTTPVKKGRKTARGVGISAEPQSLKSLQDLTTKTFPSYKKSERAGELIRAAIMDNDFMKNLETSQIKVRDPQTGGQQEDNNLVLAGNSGLHVPDGVCERFTDNQGR